MRLFGENRRRGACGGGKLRRESNQDSAEDVGAMGDATMMYYRYLNFHLPIARYVSRLSPAAKTAVIIAQIILLGTLLAFELGAAPSAP